VKEVGDQKQLEFTGGVDDPAASEAEAASSPA
jgi:hypothetical protein